MPNTVDLRTIYTPAYFEYLGLTMATTTGGGGEDEYTVPFKYFVYAIEQNPVTRALFPQEEAPEEAPD